MAAALSLFFLSLPSVCLTFILGTFNIIISGYITADSSLPPNRTCKWFTADYDVSSGGGGRGQRDCNKKNDYGDDDPRGKHTVVIDGEGKAHHSTPRH